MGKEWCPGTEYTGTGIYHFLVIFLYKCFKQKKNAILIDCKKIGKNEKREMLYLGILNDFFCI